MPSAGPRKVSNEQGIANMFNPESLMEFAEFGGGSAGIGGAGAQGSAGGRRSAGIPDGLWEIGFA